MFVYLSKKIAIPNNTTVRSLGWNRDHGYIACGCDGGLLKILKLETRRDDSKGSSGQSSSNLSNNQTLDGHTGSVNLVRWNETYQKLTSSDHNGLIMVWMLHQGVWYEEMINNRNKSVVTGMAWNSDGQKICIVYEDGAIIVGSVDGNRIWGKELKGVHLGHVEWSPDGKLLLFGLQNGEIHLYESGGTFISKLPMPFLDGTSGVKIIAIRWCKKHKRDVDGSALVVAFESGLLQMMRNENDKSALLVDTETHITSMDWNQDGTMLAITGYLSRGETEKKNIVKFYDSKGRHLQSIRIPGKSISGCSWEGGGLRIALAVDSYIFFANIRMNYKWCYFADTLAYVYDKLDRLENAVMFWNTATKEKHVKLVKNLVSITSALEFCAFVTKADDASGQYSVVLCNAIGSPLDSRFTEVEPCHLVMNNSYIFVASGEAVYSWHFHSPKNQAILELTSERMKVGQERTFYIDESKRGLSGSRSKANGTSDQDKICCLATSDKILVIGRASGVFLRYQLPQLNLTHHYIFECKPSRIMLNCTSSRMSVIDINGILTLYDLESEITDVSGSETVGQKLKFERKDVWDIKWALDNPEMFAIMEKTRMYIFRNLDPEEPVSCSGYMCEFSNLEVKAILLDELLQNPDDPNMELVIQNEVKSLRDTRGLLDKVGIQEATKFIEDNSHPRLWKLLAEDALKKTDFETAELGFIHCQDYLGIKFCKRLATLNKSFIREAEVATYFKDFDKAEKFYLDNNRPDLAIDLRELIEDWFRVAQLLKMTAASDQQIERAWNKIGDYYCDRQKWENAITYYLQGHNQDRIAKCYYMLEDYAGLESLVNSLHENHAMLPEIGSMFASIGMCEQAVLAYLKCSRVKEAIDTCVKLSQWNMAINLAKKHNIKEIDGLLAQYAKHLIDENKILDAVELYRKAHKFLDAARMLLKFTREEAKKNRDLLTMKKLYVLIGMLMEDHRGGMKKTTSALKRTAMSSSPYLWNENLMLPNEEAELVFEPWKGAEAYHYMLLVHRQLYSGSVDAATKAAVNLRDYEDVLDAEELYCLIALASCANRSFAICSSAFMKLESMEKLDEQQQKEYTELAFEIFLKHPPNDSRVSRSECYSCNSMIADYSTTCPKCNTKFPVCVASGKPIIENTPKWTCGRCHHSACKQEMNHRKICPLCHYPNPEQPN